MKILVCVITHNCVDVLPFFLRHYLSFTDEIWAFDDFSTDGTRPILSAFDRVLRGDWDHPGSGIDENLFLDFAYRTYSRAKHNFDWVIWVDPDEFVYAPNIRQVLRDNIGKYDVLRTGGYNMVGNGMPKDDGRQIWEISPMGTMDDVYSKPVIFNPAAEVRWDRGKHHLENCSARVSPTRLLKILHYRYLGADYTRAKNAKNYARCGLRNNDKGAAWTCAPGYDGIDKAHSPAWAEEQIKNAFNAVEAQLYP